MYNSNSKVILIHNIMLQGTMTYIVLLYWLLLYMHRPTVVGTVHRRLVRSQAGGTIIL